MEKKYKLTEKELGDIFEGKVIYTDTLDLVIYILEETKDPTTGQRRYNHVLHTYWDIGDPEKPPHEDVEYPPLPISKDDMDLFHSPGRYMIKVVNRHNKAKSYGSVTFYNDGDNYKEIHSEWRTSHAADKKTNSARIEIISIEKRLQTQESRISNISKMLLDLKKSVEKLSQEIEEYIY